MPDKKPRVFSGRSNPELTDKITRYLNIEPGSVDIKTFKDGEIWVKYQENIRGRDVYIVQPTQPPAENLLELLIMVDAAKRSAAKRVTVVTPYFGYSRQDRKDQPRVSITAKLVANLIAKAGADRVIAMDLHAPQIQGFFDIPFDHLYGSSIFTSVFKNRLDNLVVVSPDMGGIKLARSYATRLNAGLVVIDKRRPRANEMKIMHVIGEVDGKNVLIVDDMIDTGGTFAATVHTLKAKGARAVYGAVTHPLFSADALEKLEKSGIDELYATDTIPLKFENKYSWLKIRTASELFAEAIKRSFENRSISSLFEIDKG